MLALCAADPDPDLELGPLDSAPTTLELDSHNTTNSNIAYTAGLGGWNGLQLISDTLEVCSRHLQAHNQVHSEYLRAPGSE